MSFNFKRVCQDALALQTTKYTVCGAISFEGVVYPLGSDTKVLSSVFELFTRPIVASIANDYGFELVEPLAQNHYPDFTLMKGRDDRKKIAIDVKTTYIDNPGDTFSYTLGGYTSFMRPGNESKNIVFPFGDYSEHWVIGYVYERVAAKKSGTQKTYSIRELDDVPLPYKNVRVFVQEKWKIASDHAGSGNTTNIGSITAHIDGFQQGLGRFSSESEFLHYWRNYCRTDAERTGKFRNIAEYKEWLKSNGKLSKG